MPSHRAHLYIDRIYLGKTYPKVHREMDRPVIFLGKRHRVLWHDYATAKCIASRCYPGDPRAIESAMLHIMYDELCSKHPEFKKELERKAKNAVKARRRSKRESNKIKKMIENFTKEQKRARKAQKKQFQKFLKSLK